MLRELRHDVTGVARSDDPANRRLRSVALSQRARLLHRCSSTREPAGRPGAPSTPKHVSSRFARDPGCSCWRKSVTDTSKKPKWPLSTRLWPSMGLARRARRTAPSWLLAGAVPAQTAHRGGRDAAWAVVGVKIRVSESGAGSRWYENPATRRQVFLGAGLGLSHQRPPKLCLARPGGGPRWHSACQQPAGRVRRTRRGRGHRRPGNCTIVCLLGASWVALHVPPPAADHLATATWRAGSSWRPSAWGHS